MVTGASSGIGLELAKQFANHTIERAYNAVVWGAPRDSTGRIESQIGRSPFDRKRMTVLRSGGKKAATTGARRAKTTAKRAKSTAKRSAAQRTRKSGSKAKAASKSGATRG